MILRRLDKYSEVVREWEGQTAVLIGGGPSLTINQIDKVKRLRAIGINDAYRIAPWIDVCYFADFRWYGWHKDKPEFKSFAGQKCTIESGQTVIADDVHVLRNGGNFGISKNPKELKTGRNSGFQALNLAVLAGAKRIILLGFDGQPSKEGKTHWFGHHPIIESNSSYQLYQSSFSYAEKELVAMGIEVINCSPGSAINSFPKKILDEVL